MGCRDQESNFQYTHYDPTDDKWWCSYGHVLTYAVPKGYEAVLRDKIARYASVRWNVKFNRDKQMWEATVVKK